MIRVLNIMGVTMYFVYVDESGEKKPTSKRTEPYVLFAVTLHEYQWRKFEAILNGGKLRLLQRIYQTTSIQLELADAEMHSNPIRIATERATHKFLKHLTESELTDLVELFYSQIKQRHMRLFAVVIDKEHLDSFMDFEKTVKKAYELLLERVETFINNEHHNQNAVFVLDNTSIQLNKSIAMKHSYFQRCGTSAGLKLRHIVELPFFVESHLSNGVQLADLCVYNVFRAFRNEDATYKYFQRLLPYFYSSNRTSTEKIDGLKIFPDNHRWNQLLNQIQTERTRILSENAGS